MEFVSHVSPATNGQATSNGSTNTLSENKTSSSSVQSIAQVNIIPQTFEDGAIVSLDLPTSTEEDISTTLMSTTILEMIFDYALNKFDDCRDRLEAGRPKFISVLNKFVKEGARIEMSLPAFPFKSANKVYKVLGFLPDKAEEIALARLDNMCRRIEEIYIPGAKVVLISDGLVYNDLLSISDRDTWLYGEALREMAAENGFTHIGFSRLRDLVDLELPETLDEIHYVANATNFRRSVLNRFGRDDLDVNSLIASDEDTRLTYQGYRRFLMSDLRYIFTLGGTRTSNSYKRETKYLAKQMLVRGYAFAGAIKENFPNHLRLSIHQSTGEHKVSMSLLNTKTGFTTPWHCSVALMADGEWMSAPMGDFRENPRMKIISEKGRPSYFQEMTEEEFVEEQRMQAAQLIEEVVVEENHQPQRNENFFQWESVTYDCKKGDKPVRVLDHVEGWLRGGTMTILMGVSGAGKELLLNIIGNCPGSGIIHGDILINGKPRDMASKNTTGIVHQPDLQFATATVKEVLIFSAMLRQPKTTPYAEKITYVEKVISLIGMEKLADTVIEASGESLNSEQMKRLAIGVELAAKPTTVLLLEQPLSKLDSRAALSICALLRKIAQTGLAILCTVNQPSTRILQSFDRLILLAEGGKQLYFGKIGVSCKTVASYFERHGARPCNADENLAEWMLEITSSTPEFDGPQVWSEIWKNSSEHWAIKSKLANLKKKFPKRLDPVNSLHTAEIFEQSAVALDAMALQRTFYKYISLENIQPFSDTSKSDFCGCWLTKHASVNTPACLSQTNQMS